MYKLRLFKLSDINWLMNNIETERECRFWSGNMFKYPFVKKELIDYCCELGDSLNFSLCDTNSGEVLGHIRVGEIDEKMKSATIQNVLVDKEHRKKGTGIQMLFLTCRFIFDNFDVNVIRLRVKSNNISAIRCYQKIGFIELKGENSGESLRMFLTSTRFKKNCPIFIDKQNNSEITTWYRKYRGNLNRIIVFPQEKREKQALKDCEIIVDEAIDSIEMEIAIFTYIALFFQRKQSPNALYIINVKGNKYICFCQGQPYYIIYQDLLNAIKNNIFAPTNIENFAEEIIEIRKTEVLEFLDEDVSLKIENNKISLYSKEIDFDSAKVEIQSELNQCLKTIKNILRGEHVSSVDVISQIFLKKSKITINHKVYDNGTFVSDLEGVLGFLFKNKITGYKTRIDINNPYKYVILSLALFLSNNELNSQDCDILFSNCNVITKNTFLINVETVFKNLNSQSYKKVPTSLDSQAYYSVLDNIFLGTPVINGIEFISKIILGDCANVEFKDALGEQENLKLKSILLKVFQDSLNKQSIDENSNFFLEGGNSLSAMKVILELEKKEIFLSINDLINWPTISLLEGFINTRRSI